MTKQLKRTLSLLLAIMMIVGTVSILPFTASASLSVTDPAVITAAEAVQNYVDETGENLETQRIYFQIPNGSRGPVADDDVTFTKEIVDPETGDVTYEEQVVLQAGEQMYSWENEFNVVNGASNPAIYWYGGSASCEDHTYGGVGWVGYRMETEDAEQGIFYADVPLDVNTIVFNNGVDGGFDPDDPIFAEAMQTPDINIEGAWEGDYESLPYGSPDTDSFDGCIFIVDPNQLSVSSAGQTTVGGNWYVYYGDGCYGGEFEDGTNNDDYPDGTLGWTGYIGDVCVNPDHFAGGEHVGYQPAQTYTVTWIGWNGETLETDTDLMAGSTPSYGGATPEKPADDYYTYTFSGWTDGTDTYGPSDELPAVTGDAAYTACFAATPKTPDSEVIFDFEDGTTNGFELLYSNYNYYLPKHDVEVVMPETGKVHSGNYALALNIDYSNNQEGGYQMIALYQGKVSGNVNYYPGAKSLGAWIYIPDEFVGLWARWMLAPIASDDGEGNYTLGSQVISNLMDNTAGGTGVVYSFDESGWHYLKADFTNYMGVAWRDFYYCIQFYISDRSGASYGYNFNDQHNINGSFTLYIDDITVDYSTVTEDRDAPVFSGVLLTDRGAYSEEPLVLTNGYDSDGYDQLSFSANVADFAASNSTGVDAASAAAYIDGNEVECTYADGLISIDDEYTFNEGQHKVKFVVCDNAGNRASATRTFTVSNVSGAELVKVVPHDPTLDRVLHGSLYWIDVVTMDAANTEYVSVTLNLDSMSTWELEHMEVADGFEVNYGMIDEGDKIVMMRISAEDEITATGELVLVSIPIRTWEMDNMYKESEIYVGKNWNYAEFKASHEFWPVATEVRVENGLAYLGDTPVFFTGEDVFVWSESWANYSNMTSQDSAYLASWNGGHDHRPEYADYYAEGTTNHTNPEDIIYVAGYEPAEATCTTEGFTGRTFCTVCSSVVDWGEVIPATGHSFAIDPDDGIMKCTVCGAVATYTINWANDDGTLIDTTTVAYGEVPTHADPTKADDGGYTYIFSGWTPDVVAVTGDATYTATFAECSVLMGAAADSAKTRADLYFTIPDGADPADFTVTVNGVTTALDTITPTANGYKFSIMVPAKNMGDKIAYILDYCGEAIKSGEVSVADYANNLAALYPQYADFADAMLAYGAAAQMYFGYNTDNLVSDADLTALPAYTGDRFDATAINSVLKSKAIPVYYSAMNVTFLSDTTFSIAFRIKGGFTNDAALEWVNANITLDGEAVSGTVSGSGNYRYVIISKQNIAIDELDEPITLAVGVQTYDVSVLNYFAAVEEQGSDSLKALTRALYAYSQEAKAIAAASSAQTKSVTLTLNDYWNEDSAEVENVTVPDASSCTWADIKSQNALTSAYWYCANDSETVTVSGDTASVSNVTRMLTTTAADDAIDVPISEYSVYTGTGAAFQGITTPAGYFKIDDTDAAMSGKYIQLNKLDLGGVYNSYDWCSGTYGKEDEDHTSDTIGGFGENCGTFDGVYAGMGKQITSISTNLEGETSGYVGLFAKLGTNAIVKDVYLNGYNPESNNSSKYKEITLRGAYCVGGIAGLNQGQILNCYFAYWEGTVLGYGHTYSVLEFGGTHTGGVAGHNEGTVMYCAVYTGSSIDSVGHLSSEGNWEEESMTGGIVGSNTGIVAECSFSGYINATTSGDYLEPSGGGSVGGIAGFNSGTVTNCLTYLNFICAYRVSGGIVGVNFGGTVTNCFGQTFSMWYHDFEGLGEIAGEQIGGTVANCYFSYGAGAYNDHNCTGGGDGVDLSAVSSAAQLGLDPTVWSFDPQSYDNPVLITVPTYDHWS